MRLFAGMFLGIALQTDDLDVKAAAIFFGVVCFFISLAEGSNQRT